MLQDYDTSVVQPYLLFTTPGFSSPPLSLSLPRSNLFSSLVARYSPLYRLSFDLLPEKVISNGIDTPVGNGLSQKESHQIHSRTFLAVSPGLATVCAASPHFDHDLFRTIWSYVIHFPSPVTIRLRNDSISFRLARSSQMEIRSIMFFGVNW
ncbi:hypothetical protein TNCV_1790182 [Trichonephila clavipes]|nr:hypothetical protein TNCV_1790182 [Trichonephila clavipes]